MEDHEDPWWLWKSHWPVLPFRLLQRPSSEGQEEARQRKQCSAEGGAGCPDVLSQAPPIPPLRACSRGCPAGDPLPLPVSCLTQRPPWPPDLLWVPQILKTSPTNFSQHLLQPTRLEFAALALLGTRSLGTRTRDCHPVCSSSSRASCGHHADGQTDECRREGHTSLILGPDTFLCKPHNKTEMWLFHPNFQNQK